jgi:hypothetical protein
MHPQNVTPLQIATQEAEEEEEEVFFLSMMPAAPKRK